jgi:hypothetical protein
MAVIAIGLALPARADAWTGQAWAEVPTCTSDGRQAVIHFFNPENETATIGTSDDFQTTLAPHTGTSYLQHASATAGNASVFVRMTWPSDQNGWSTTVPVKWATVPCVVVTIPVDTTPKPVPTSAPGDVQLCVQPGSNPPRMVPCDSPEATTPATTVPETTTTVETCGDFDTPEHCADYLSTTTTMITIPPDAPTLVPLVQGRVVGPPRADALPATGSGVIGMTIGGGFLTLAGLALLAAATRAVATGRRQRYIWPSKDLERTDRPIGCHRIRSDRPGKSD